MSENARVFACHNDPAILRTHVSPAVRYFEPDSVSNTVRIREHRSEEPDIVQGATRYFDPSERAITSEGEEISEFCFRRKLRLLLMFVRPEFLIEAPLRSDSTAGNATRVDQRSKLRYWERTSDHFSFLLIEVREEFLDGKNTEGTSGAEYLIAQMVVSSLDAAL